MKLEIFGYIEIRYNRKKSYSTLNYQSIQEFTNETNIYKNAD
jgi:hypothetical protein